MSEDEVLDAATACAEHARRAEVDLVRVAYQWAVLHDPTRLDPAEAAKPAASTGAGSARTGHPRDVVGAERLQRTTSYLAAAVWSPTAVGPPDAVARWAAATFVRPRWHPRRRQLGHRTRPRAGRGDPRPLCDFAPQLVGARVLETLVGLRPGRPEVGVELDLISVPVIHNYGHGGAGITLSWRCAHEVRIRVNHLAPSMEQGLRDN